MNSLNKLSNKLVKAFLQNKIISPVPLKYAISMKEAQKLRRLCESKISKPVVGFKAAGTGIPVLKKLGEKEPFYASIFQQNVLKSGKSVRINKYTLGTELEVAYLVKKKFFELKKKINFKNIHQFISYMMPAIEVVGYRQRKNRIKYLGDLCSDFGANVKFVIGKKTKYKKINPTIRFNIINLNSIDLIEDRYKPDIDLTICFNAPNTQKEKRITTRSKLRKLLHI